MGALTWVGPPSRESAARPHQQAQPQEGGDGALQLTEAKAKLQQKWAAEGVDDTGQTTAEAGGPNSSGVYIPVLPWDV